MREASKRSHMEFNSMRRTKTHVKLLAAVLILLIVFHPLEARATNSKKEKTKKPKYAVNIQNADSNTVLKKGTKLKLRCTVNAKKRMKVKIKYKSSNPRVATITQKGVIKARKKGRTRITAISYVNGKKRKKKTIVVRVGKPTTKIEISGHAYLRVGKSTKLKATIWPQNATNKKLTWTSSNPRAVSVDNKGRVVAKGNGIATISAKSKDGSKTGDSVTIYSHKYTREETKWIAHMGLHTYETQNTAAAFEAAGDVGFWGCECDVYETKHDEDGNFEIVIDHDGNFSRIFGVDARPSELTAEEIRANPKLAKVCFLSEYLKICKHYNMVPVIEIKALSDKGIEKIIDMLKNNDLLERNKAHLISFSSYYLGNAEILANEKYNADVYTAYLMIGSDVEAKLREARAKKLDGISIYYDSLNENVSKQCDSLGLIIGTWTYGDSFSYYKKLYEHVVLHQYNIDTVTIDGAVFN